MRREIKDRYTFWQAILQALFLSLVFIAIPIFITVTWETNDDTTIAFLLSRSDNDFSTFQWIGLSKFVHFLNVHLPVIDWWAGISIFAIWLGAFSACYIIFRRYPYGHSFLVASSCLVALWFVAVYRVNFTRTAIAVAMPGCMLIADSIFTSKSRPSWLQFAIGCLLLLFGASIRYSSAAIALGFLAVIGVVRLLADHPMLSIEWIKDHLRQMCVLFLAAVIFFAASKVNDLCLTPDQKDYVAYNKLRASIQDYTAMYPSYDDAFERCYELGLSATAYDLLLRWGSEDSTIMTVEVMEQVAELRAQTSSLDLIISAMKGNYLPIALMLAVICLISIHRRQNWIRNHIVLDALLLIVVYLSFFRGRLPARVLMPVIWAAMCASIFLSGGDDRLNRSQLCSFWCGFKIFVGNRCTWLKRACIISVTMLFIIVTGIGLWRANELIQLDINPFAIQEKEEKRVKNRQFYDSIQEDSEHIYIFDIFTESGSIHDAFSFWEPRPDEYCVNRFRLGGWSAHHPYHMNLLAEQRITNPYSALYDHPDVYTIYSQRVVNHLRSNYNNLLTSSAVNEIQGNPIVKYAIPINDYVIPYSDSESSTFTKFEYISNYHGHKCWYFEAEISTDAVDNRHFYCNITVDNVRYTYALAYENGKVHAYLYDLNKDFNISEADLALLELTENGEYIKYNIYG